MITASTIIVSTTEPLVYKDGSFWYDLTNNKLMLRKNGVWENAVSANKIDLTDIENAIANLDNRLNIIETKNSIEFKVVSALPSVAEADSGTVYLVPNGKTGSKNVYDEYILITKEDDTKTFEVIGSTAVELSGYMKNDGSNYINQKTLVTPTIDGTLQVYSVDNTLVTTIDVASTSDLSYTAVPGAKVTFTGHFTNPIPKDSSYTSPTSCTGDFGSVLPTVGESSSNVTLTTTENKKYTVTFSKPCGGLLVKNNKVVKATGNDTTSATLTISYKNFIFYGISTKESLSADEVAKLDSVYNTSAKIGEKSFKCTDNHYCYICFPTEYAIPTINYGTTVVGFVDAGTLDIVNTAGKTVAYKCMRSGQKYNETMIFKFS